MERQSFCDFLKDLTKPKDDEVSQKCKAEISQRGVMIRGDSSESEARGSSYGRYRKRGRVTDLRQD